MRCLLTLLLVLPSLTAVAAEDSAIELEYRGTLGPRRSTLKASEKQFSVYCLVRREAGTIGFVLTESSPGGWPWPERFGRISLASKGRPAGSPRLQLLYDHQGTKYPHRLARPVFEYVDRLKEGAKWTADRKTWTVVGARRKLERDCWQVDQANNFGRLGAVWVERSTGLVVAERRRVFMGMGDEFMLDVELAKLRPVSGERLAALDRPFETLLVLQRRLNRKPNHVRPQLDAAQVRAAASLLEPLLKQAASTPFAAIASDIERDVKRQSRRGVSVDDLARRFLGKPAPPFQLTTIDRRKIDSKKLAGKVVVLHFWSYSGDQLEEPYGQVGYLDFVYGKRRRLGVEVIGVAVNSQLATKGKSRRALRSIKKLHEFMRLAYPVTTDSGKLLAAYGDPRRLDAKLPLWVVIAADGRVVHYQVGYYSIKPDEGLKQLDAILIKQVRAARKTKSRKSD